MQNKHYVALGEVQVPHIQAVQCGQGDPASKLLPNYSELSVLVSPQSGTRAAPALTGCRQQYQKDKESGQKRECTEAAPPEQA